MWTFPFIPCFRKDTIDMKCWLIYTLAEEIWIKFQTNIMTFTTDPIQEHSESLYLQQGPTPQILLMSVIVNKFLNTVNDPGYHCQLFLKFPIKFLSYYPNTQKDT